MREQFAGWGLYDHLAVCIDCRHQHLIAKGEQVSAQPWLDWQAKHRGHAVRLVPYSLVSGIAERLARLFNPAYREFAEFAHNANVKAAYAASAAYTCTLTGLASSSTLVAGRESTWVSNTSNLYLDELIACKIGVNEGVNVTANTYVESWAVGTANDTPTYPDTFTGTDAAVTLTNLGIKAGICRNVGGILCPSAAQNFKTYAGPVGARQLFGDALPSSHGIFVTHNTGQNLGATASNHVLSHTPVYATVT